jgi:hypothetical protein
VEVEATDLHIDLRIARRFTLAVRTVWLVTFFGVLLVCGCAGPKSAAQAPNQGSADVRNQKLIVMPGNALAGKVLKVNSTARFVVLNFPIGKLPAIDQRLSVYRRNLKVGEVKVTGPQREDNIVADIFSGEAEVGDDVLDR